MNHPIDAFARNPFHGWGAYQTYEAAQARFTGNAPLIASEIRRRPSITTYSELRNLITDTLRFGSLNLSTAESRWYAQAVRAVDAGARNSQEEVTQIIRVFKTGSQPANVSPSPIMAEFLEGMISAGKIDFGAINETGGTGRLSNVVDIQQQDKQFEEGREPPSKFQKWWKKNKKIVIGAGSGVAILIIIGMIARKPKQSVPADFKPRRRIR